METSYPTSSTNSNGPAWQTGKVLKLNNMAKIPDHSNLKTGRLTYQIWYSYTAWIAVARDIPSHSREELSLVNRLQRALK
jgi:hypothetical protein